MCVLLQSVCVEQLTLDFEYLINEVIRSDAAWAPQFCSFSDYDVVILEVSTNTQYCILALGLVNLKSLLCNIAQIYIIPFFNVDFVLAFMYLSWKNKLKHVLYLEMMCVWHVSGVSWNQHCDDQHWSAVTGFLQLGWGTLQVLVLNKPKSFYSPSSAIFLSDS